MMNPVRRLLLGSSAAILVLGAFMHSTAFGRVQAAVATSNLEPFFGASLKALWLIDSVTLVALAIIFGLAAARPGAVSRAVLFILACIPGATALFLYRFLGPFIPAHMLLVSAVAAIFGASGGREA